MHYALRNKVQLIGHVGQQPEVRTTESGKKRGRFSIATSETYRNANGEKITDTQWHNLVVWGSQAEIAEKYLPKGREIAVEGRLVRRTYTDKEGTRKHITEIHVHEILLLGKSN